MNIPPLSYLAPPLFSTGICAALALFAGQRKNVSGAASFAIILWIEAIWSLAHAGELAASGLDATVFFDNLQYITLDVIVIAGLVFALEYTGQTGRLRWWAWALLAVEPVINAILIWTDSAHHLFRANTALVDNGAIQALRYDYGAWGWISTTYAVLLILAALALLAGYGVRGVRISRRQTAIVLIGLSLPWWVGLSNMAGTLPWHDRDIFVYTFGISGPVLAVGLFRFRLFDLAPVARAAVIQHIDDGMMILDRQGRIIDMNPAAARITGGPATGEDAVRLLPEWETAREASPPGERVTTEIARTLNDQDRIFTLIASPLHNRRQALTGTLIMLHDITQTRQSETRYRQMFERNRAIQLLVDPHSGAIMDANPAAAAYYRYARRTLKTLNITDLCALPRDDVFAAMHQALAGTQTSFELRHRLSDGTIREVAIHSSPVDFQDRTLLYFIVTDIAERQQAENALRTNIRFLNTLIDTIPNPIFYKDREGRFQGCNQRLADDILGLPKERILGRTEYDLIPLHQQADMYHHGDMTLIERPGTWVYETRLRCANGQERDFIVNKATFVDANGQVAGIVAVMVDISTRKRAEEERELLIEDLNAFAHTVAHDLKNPLSAVIGMAGLLYEEFDLLPADEKIKLLRVIEEEGYAMSRIIDELLLLSSLRRSEQVSISPLNMASIVDTTLQRMDYLIRECGAQITLSRKDWPNALGYGAWVEEVWSNYVSNALKYGGSPPYVVLGADDPVDGMVRFWVRDNGPGIPPEAMDRLFTRFTRLDQTRARGHGLGLSIVQRIVTRLGGEVQAESLPGEGSLFSFTLPRAP